MNILRLEVPLSHTEYSVTWSSAVLLLKGKTPLESPYFCTRTLLFFGKPTLIPPPTYFLIFVHEGWTLWRTEKQWHRNKLMTRYHGYVHTGTVRDWQRQGGPHAKTARMGPFYYHDTFPSTLFGRQRSLPDVMYYPAIRSVTVYEKCNKPHQSASPLKGQTMARRHRLA